MREYDLRGRLGPVFVSITPAGGVASRYEFDGGREGVEGCISLLQSLPGAVAVLTYRRRSFRASLYRPGHRLPGLCLVETNAAYSPGSLFGSESISVPVPAPTLF